jgi:hypothetical protein
VFFFINAACMSSSDDYDDYGPYDDYEDCPEARDNTTPAGASSSILEPRSGQAFSQAPDGARVSVPVKLAATGIQLADERVCATGTGHFILSLQREEDGSCVGLLPVGSLANGSSAWLVELWPGRYTLTAEVVTGIGLHYEPALIENVQFVVEGVPPPRDPTVCP